MKISPELGKKWVYYWEVYSQNSSPEVLNFTGTVAVKYYYSIQTFLVLKRCSPSTGTQKFRNSQPESKTPLGLFHILHPPKGLSRVPFESGRSAQEEGFQIAFVSGCSLACFPKEALTGERAVCSHALLYFCRGLWFYLCGIYTMYEKTFQWDWVFIC